MPLAAFLALGGIFLFFSTQYVLFCPVNGERVFYPPIGGLIMTGEQKKQITDLRSKGFGYATIAQALGLSKSTVTSHCQRNKLGGIKANHSPTVTPDKEYCKQCGKELIQISGKKKLKFCNQECRVTWWNSNQDKVKKKAIY